MKELTIEEKIAEIKNTMSYQDVKNAWLPPYYEKEYYFVSYSHRDYKLVYESLHRLQSGKKRLNLWYDHNLAPGRDWGIEARRYIYDFNCKGVIFFLSENAVLSQSIHKEIEFVKESGKSYLSINLPCEKIAGHIDDYLSAAEMLELLKQQGHTIENYEAKSAVLSETFNNKVIYLSFNEDIDSQIDKILSLKRQPLLEINKGFVASINNLHAEALKIHDFKYLDDNDVYIFAKIIGSCAFANCRWLKKIELPKSTIMIGDYAFYNCKSLKSISIPNSITLIHDGTFSGCAGLENITISNNVTSIGSRAFQECIRLESITVYDTLISIDEDLLFFDCSGGHIIKNSIGDRAFLFCTSLKNITLPKDITSIDSVAFGYCTSLESITIPLSVTSIELFAFLGCISLKNIFYKGTKQQWKSIDKRHGWDDGTPDYTVHCTDGDLKKSEPTD